MNIPQSKYYVKLQYPRVKFSRGKNYFKQDRRKAWLNVLM